MNKHMLTSLLGVALASAMQPSLALQTFTDPTTLDTALTKVTVVNFDSVPAGTAIGTQYSPSGVEFNPFNGGSPKTIDPIAAGSTLAPTSGTNAMDTVAGFHGGGGFEAVFNTAVNGVGFQIGDLERIDGLGNYVGESIVELFGAGGASLGSFNLVDTIGEGPMQYHFFGVKSDTAITKLQVSFGSVGTGDYVNVDDFRFGAAPAPEPQTYLLWTVGLVGLLLRKRRVSGIRLDSGAHPKRMP
jgi:hypothetical protein